MCCLILCADTRRSGHAIFQCLTFLHFDWYVLLALPSHSSKVHILIPSSSSCEVSHGVSLFAGVSSGLSSFLLRPNNMQVDWWNLLPLGVNLCMPCDVRNFYGITNFNSLEEENDSKQYNNLITSESPPAILFSLSHTRTVNRMQTHRTRAQTCDGKKWHPLRCANENVL